MLPSLSNTIRSFVWFCSFSYWILSSTHPLIPLLASSSTWCQFVRLSHWHSRRTLVVSRSQPNCLGDLFVWSSHMSVSKGIGVSFYQLETSFTLVSKYDLKRLNKVYLSNRDQSLQKRTRTLLMTMEAVASKRQFSIRVWYVNSALEYDSGCYSPPLNCCMFQTCNSWMRQHFLIRARNAFHIIAFRLLGWSEGFELGSLVA